MTLPEAIAHFRTLETAESVLPLVESGPDAALLRQAALLWPSVPPPVLDDPACIQTESWPTLWDAVTYDPDPLTALLGVNARPLLQRLIALRLIYPDGTLSAVAAKALRQLAKNKLGL